MDTNTNIFIKDISYSIENFELSLVLNRKEIDMLSSATGLHDAFFFSESVELDAYYKIEEYYIDMGAPTKTGCFEPFFMGIGGFQLSPTVFAFGLQCLSTNASTSFQQPLSILLFNESMV